MSTIFGVKVTVALATNPTVPILTFNDSTARPTGASVFTCDLLDGWKSTSQLNSVLSTVYGVDGQIPADNFYYSARHVTLAGAVEGTSETNKENLETALKRGFPRNTYLVVTKYETTPKFITCLVENTKVIAEQQTRTGFRFSIPLVAPDPLRYGTALKFDQAGVAGFSSGGFSFPLFFPLVFATSDNGASQIATIINDGDGWSPPVFTIQGPLDRGWFLENITTGDIMSFDLALAAGDTLVIDCLNQVAYVNGNDLVVSFIIGSFFRLSPGTNQIKLFGNFNTFAGFKVQAYSGYE